MKHPQADILLAIADGKEIQAARFDQPEEWTAMSHQAVLATLGMKIPNRHLRVKPDTCFIFGIEVQRPIDYATYDRLPASQRSKLIISSGDYGSTHYFRGASVSKYLHKAMNRELLCQSTP